MIICYMGVKWYESSMTKKSQELKAIESTKESYGEYFKTIFRLMKEIKTYEQRLEQHEKFVKREANKYEKELLEALVNWDLISNEKERQREQHSK